MHSRLFALIAVVFFSCQLTAQIINDAATGATVTLDHQSAEAGETVNGSLILSPASNQQLDVLVQFRSPRDSFNFDQTVPANATTVNLVVQIPPDLPTDTYDLSIYAVRRNSIPIALTAPVKLHVTAKPSKDTLPSKATVEFNPNQKQYIREQTEPLEALKSTLLDYLEHHGSEAGPVRDELIRTLKSADALLPAVEEKYVSYYKIPPKLKPVLFVDFDRQYRAALVQLGAPPQASPPMAYEVPFMSPVRLLAVQELKSRRPGPPPLDQDWKSLSLSGIYTLQAKAVLSILELNIRAYALIGSTGLDTFTISFNSDPTGARVSYKRAGEEFTYLTKETYIGSATFPYAMWTFRFEKNGCRPEYRSPNPYIEDNPDLSVELRCKGR
jgi:hypothetical protein